MLDWLLDISMCLRTYLLSYTTLPVGDPDLVLDITCVTATKCEIRLDRKSFDLCKTFHVQV
jgi:hypothetical protein